MSASCRKVQQRIDFYFDENDANGGISDYDLIHIHNCRGCGEYYRGYSRFSGALKSSALEAIEEMGEPDWRAFLAAGPGAGATAGLPSASSDSAAEHSRRLPRWATGIAAKAAVLAAIVGLGALVGYDQYRMASARSYVRANTTEFVNAIFASSLFSTDPQSSTPVEPTMGWFDATTITSDLPLPTEVAGSSGGTPSLP